MADEPSGTNGAVPAPAVAPSEPPAPVASPAPSTADTAAPSLPTLSDLISQADPAELARVLNTHNATRSHIDKEASRRATAQMASERGRLAAEAREQQIDDLVQQGRPEDAMALFVQDRAAKRAAANARSNAGQAEMSAGRRMLEQMRDSLPPAVQPAFWQAAQSTDDWGVLGETYAKLRIGGVDAAAQAQTQASAARARSAEPTVSTATGQTPGGLTVTPERIKAMDVTTPEGKAEYAKYYDLKTGKLKPGVRLMVPQGYGANRTQ